MSTITKERAQQIFLGNGPEPTASEERELARIALASLEAVPVAYMTYKGYLLHAADPKLAEYSEPTPLYDAPPAPVALPSGYSDFEEIWSSSTHPLTQDDEMKDFAWDIWNACRAAMFQGADRPQNEPQNIPENIPATQFKPVADLYGLTSPTGDETSFTFDAVEARDFIDGGWSCQEYVELERFQEVMLQNGNSPAQDGNYPVVPDGYVMVPKEMTDEIGEAIAMQANCCGGIALDIYDAMIAAAPHDTPALNSVQSVVHVSDGWIPVSERMPEDDDFVYIWPRPDFGVELHIGQYCERNHKGGGWYAQVYEQNYGIEWHPITVTHWMPLPAGPQGVKGE